MNPNYKINVIFPEIVLPYVAMQANDDLHIYENPPYISAVDEFLITLSPKYCLELGAGIGRMSLYFYKRFNWTNTHYYLQDGNSGIVQYGGIRSSKTNDFYNSFEATEAFCKANGLTNITIVEDVQAIKNSIDFLYSFAAIGFHWDIDLYLDKVLPVLNKNAKLLFEIRAPLERSHPANDILRKEYQAFYESQINYAKAHPHYQVIDIIDLRNYEGRVYKDRSHFLILAPKLFAEP